MLSEDYISTMPLLNIQVITDHVLSVFSFHISVLQLKILQKIIVSVATFLVLLTTCSLPSMFVYILSTVDSISQVYHK